MTKIEGNGKTPDHTPDHTVLDIPEDKKLDNLFKDKVPSYTTDKGVNLKHVAAIVLGTIGVTAAAIALSATLVAVLGVTAFAAIPVIPMVIVASVAAGVALAIIGVALWERITPHLPQCLRDAANWVQTIVTETFGVIALGVLFPINSTWFDPKKKEQCDPNQTPILMIHGFLGSSNNWVYHRHLLHKNGHKNVFTINLGSAFKTMEEYGQAVEDKVKEIKTLTGRNDLIIVGHSMGGLVGKEYIYNHAKQQDVKVLGEISFGTPHNGTKIAKLASWLLPPAKAMEYGSDYVKGLQGEAEKDEECQFTHVTTRTDAVIVPGASAKESKAHRMMENKELDATGHVGYLFSHTAGVHMLNAINQLKNPAAA